jgi:hypothetical protein
MGATDSDKERTPKMSNPSFVQDAVEMAATKLEQDARKAQEEGQLWERQAQELYRRARNLRMDVQQTGNTNGVNGGMATVDDWSNTEPADAMHDYMRQFPIGYRVKVSQIVTDLERGGCKVAGKLRAKSDKTPQVAAERRLFQTAAQNERMYDYDSEETREIWRIDA